MKLFRGIALVTLLLATTSACDFIKKLKGGDDADAAAEGGVAADDDAGAPTTPPPAPGVADNEDDIARFPDETKMSDAAATVRRPFNVRDAPPAGAIVSGVNPGQGVTQVASRGAYFLITFDDAKQGKKLMGWVHKDAFIPQVADAGITEPKCAAGETALIVDNHGECGKACDKDGDCPSGQACHGSAAKYVKGKAGDSVQVCTVFHPHDAGAAKDAGAPAKDGGGAVAPVDAGGGGGGGAADASAPKLAPQTVMIAPSQLGVCPDNAHLVKKDNKCHLKCPQAKLCDPHKGFCGRCDGVAVCNAERNFCPN